MRRFEDRSAAKAYAAAHDIPPEDVLPVGSTFGGAASAWTVPDLGDAPHN